MVSTLEVLERRVIVPDFMPLEFHEVAEADKTREGRRLFVVGTFGSEYLGLRDDFSKQNSTKEKEPGKKDLLLKVEYIGQDLNQIIHGIAYHLRDMGEVKMYGSSSCNFNGGIIVDREKNETLQGLIKKLLKEKNLTGGAFAHDSFRGYSLGFFKIKKLNEHPYLQRRDLIGSH